MKSKLSIMLIAICILLVFTTAIAGFNISDIFFGGEYHSFSELNDRVSNDTNEMNLDFNYKYDNDTIDLSEYESFTLNGNGHTIKGITGNESFSRQHYMTNMSFVSTNGNDWVDFAQFNKTVCLKVYTMDN